jgi:hypothetical protein
MTIQIHQLENSNTIDLIVKEIPTRFDLIKFALFCAKDCFHLNNNENMSQAQTCIDLIEKWMHKPTTVIELRNVADNIRATNSAAYAVIYASYTICTRIKNYVPYAVYAAYSSSAAFYYSTNDRLTREQKTNQYIAYAQSLLRSTTLTDFQTKGKINDKITLMAMVDELFEKNENLVFQQNNMFYLNYPKMVTVCAPTVIELVDIVWNDPSLMHYMEILYS